LGGGYTGGFISPFLGGMLVQSLGLHNVLLLAATFQVLPIISMYMLPETNPGRRSLAMAASVAGR
jgi:hypothetical protein